MGWDAVTQCCLYNAERPKKNKMKKNAAILMITLFAIGTLISPNLFAQKKKSEKERVVEIVTEMGTIKVKLYNETPLHRDNFLKLAESGEMNGSIFHRVIQGFMIQGGGKPGARRRKRTVSTAEKKRLLLQFKTARGA